jgi:hypothetical protein
MTRLAFLLLLLVWSCAWCPAQSDVTLIFGHPPDAQGALRGFNIYARSPAVGPERVLIRTVNAGTNSSQTERVWTPEPTTYFSIRAFDAYGLEGEWSSEILFEQFDPPVLFIDDIGPVRVPVVVTNTVAGSNTVTLVPGRGFRLRMRESLNGPLTLVELGVVPKGGTGAVFWTAESWPTQLLMEIKK